MGCDQGIVPKLSEVPSFEGCQHAFRPNRGFAPRPAGADVFCLYIRIARNLCRRFWFHRFAPLASTFLPPFAPRALPRFNAHTEALTPGSRMSAGLGQHVSVVYRPFGLCGKERPDHACRLHSTSHDVKSSLVESQVSLVNAHVRCLHSVSNHPMSSNRPFNTQPLRAIGFPSLRRLLTSPLASRLVTTSGRIEFVSYGLKNLLQLLPTPPHGDAVTFGYRPECVCLKRTFTSLNMCAPRRTGCALLSADLPSGEGSHCGCGRQADCSS